MESFSHAAQYTLDFINQTGRSVFLTGKAGTGKTTLLRKIIETTHKNTVVVAPTGIAALNAGGVTIHSMFQLPFGAFIPDNTTPHFSESIKFESKTSLRRHFKMSSQKRSVIRNMELLVIDEVSMLRADLLDAIDFMMQTVRKKSQPFGGVQVLFIGDLLQLPPVVRDDDWQILKKYYRGKFFFHSHVVQQYPPLYIELSKIFRQNDEVFISVLNNLRNNVVSPEDIQILNSHVQPDFDLKANKGYITLTTHNAKADNINVQSLLDLKGKEFVYEAEIVGDFPEKIFPVDYELQLKVGAQVMFIKNDLSFEKNYYNGKMGVIQSLSDREIIVYFPDEDKTIEVDKYEWQNIRYGIDQSTREISEELLGTFVQYPIKLAWAITVHKSQGLTFDKAAVDVSQVFLPGQAYVALSRLRALKGLVLLSPLQMNGISNDQDVMDYALNKASEENLKNFLHQETKIFIHKYLVSCFDWSELVQEWRNHKFSFSDKSDGPAKSKNAVWASKQLEKMELLQDPAKKFILQLNTIFANENLDFRYVSERVEAAFNYFFKPMDALVFEILWKLEEVRRIKKSKILFEELSELEEIQTKAVLQLMKAKLLIEITVSGDAISKEKLTSEEMIKYISRKKEAIQSQFKKENNTLLEEDESIYNRHSSKKKETKKSTVEETYDLWLTNYSIEDIAKIRKLTIQTVESHMVKLIQSNKISINDVFPKDRIEQLAEVFKGFEEKSLSSLKEELGEKFAWAELKMFKASLQS